MRTPTKLRHVTAITALLVVAVSTACSGDDNADDTANSEDVAAWCEAVRQAYDEMDSTGGISADVARRMHDLRPDDLDDDALETMAAGNPSVADFDDPSNWAEAEAEYEAAAVRLGEQSDMICGLDPTEEP